MNGATYRTLRESVGFGIGQAARFHNCGERTIRYWEAMPDAIPDGVAFEIEELDAVMQRAAESMINEWRGADFPTPFRIRRYNGEAAYMKESALSRVVPHAAQGALLVRIRHLLERAGATVIIEYGD